MRSAGAGKGGAGSFSIPPRYRASPVFHTPLADDGRVRDVFPLPLLSWDEGVKKKGLCRSVKQRVLRRDAIYRRANVAIAALNSLYFGKIKQLDLPVCSSVEHLPQLQRDSIHHILRCIKAAGGPPEGASCSEALRALRVAATGYQDSTGGVGEVVDQCFREEVA